MHLTWEELRTLPESPHILVEHMLILIVDFNSATCMLLLMNISVARMLVVSVAGVLSLIDSFACYYCACMLVLGQCSTFS